MTVRVYIHQPSIVFQALVDQAVVAYPTASVTYDTVSEGAFGDIEPEMTVLFGTSAGADDLGRQRIRKAADATTIYFGRSSPGVLDGEVIIQDNAHITVLNDYRPWMKAPFIKDDGTILKDHDIAYSDQNEESPPVANAGPDRCGTVDSGTSKLRLTIPPTANTSFATADGATISSYAWTLPAGVTLVTGTLTSSQITVDVDAGQRYITLEVTDSNGKTATARVFTVARGGSQSEITKKARIVSHQRTQEGQLIELELLEALPAGSYNNGTRVVIWEGEPVGGDDLSHHVFSGWHMSDPARVGAERTGFLTDTTLRCGDMAAMMRRMPEFPVEIISTASPANWGQMSSPNMDKFLHFLFTHTNVLELADWTWTGTTTDYPFVILGADGESAWDQVQRKAKALVPDYVLTCNRLGQLQTLPDPMIQQTADRTVTVQKALSESDITDISWEGQTFPRVHWLRGEAILAHASTISAVFCIAPGPTPGQGLNEQTSGEQLAKSQADLNWNEAHRYARLNAPYSYFTIILAGSDDYDVDPADMTWITASLGAQYAAARGLTLASDRFLLREVNTTWETSPTGTVKTHELLCELETEATTQAFTEIIDDADIPPPDDDYDDDPDYDDNPGPGGDGLGTLYVKTEDTLGRTRDLSADSPSYSDITPGTASTVYDFILDSYDPVDIGYLSADEGLFRSIDLGQTSPTWSLVLSKAAIESAIGSGTFGQPRKIISGINQEGLIFYSFFMSPDGNWVGVSGDRGDTWNFYFVHQGGSFAPGAIDLVPRVVNGSFRLYKAESVGATSVARSDDAGQTWSTISTDPTDTHAPICVHTPYDENTSGNIAYVGMDGSIWRTTDGTNFTSIGPGTGTNVKRHGIETSPQNRLKCILWGANGNLYISENGGDTWTQKAKTGLSGTVLGTGGFPSDQSQYYALTTQGIFISVNNGDTWLDKTGDWSFGFSAPLGVSGVIVPLWVE